MSPDSLIASDSSFLAMAQIIMLWLWPTLDLPDMAGIQHLVTVVQILRNPFRLPRDFSMETSE